MTDRRSGLTYLSDNLECMKQSVMNIHYSSTKRGQHMTLSALRSDVQMHGASAVDHTPAWEGRLVTFPHLWSLWQ